MRHLPALARDVQARQRDEAAARNDLVTWFGIAPGDPMLARYFKKWEVQRAYDDAPRDDPAVARAGKATPRRVDERQRGAGITTSKVWRERLKGPHEILDAANTLHAIRQAGGDPYAREHAQSLYDSLGPRREAFVYSDRVAPDVLWPLIQMLEGFQQALSARGLLGPQHQAALDTVADYYALTAKAKHAWRSPNPQSPLEVTWTREAIVARLQTPDGWAAFATLINMTAASELQAQLVNAPEPWRAQLFRCANYPTCRAPYALDLSHGKARLCAGCRPRRRSSKKAPRNRSRTRAL